MITPFGKLLRIFRVNRELTMRALATKVGVTSAYISGLENGKFAVTKQFLDKFADTFQLTSDEKSEFERLSANNKDYANSSADLITALSRRELSKNEIALLEEILKKNKGC